MSNDNNKNSSNKHSSRLEHAQLDWKNDNHPTSKTFDDIYFNTVSGLEDAHHTFIKHNKLTERFSSLAGYELFTIGETGFGTGLNFLCCWQHFIAQAPETARLHFISAEKHPLSPEDWQRSLEKMTSLKELTQQLTSSYVSATTGHQHLSFSDGRIKLTLLLGDVLDTLPQLEGKVDAWFLDGFTPAKNPEMWQPELFQAMASKSHLHTTYATFTSARTVKEGLIAANFNIEKASDFGLKREIMHGCLVKESAESIYRPVWFQPPAQPASENKTAIVIGGGIAGTSTAHALAERGWKVTLLEQRQQLAMAASGNSQGILYAKLSANQTALSQYIAQGYCYSINLLKQLSTEKQNLWQPSGVIQMAISAKIEKRYKELAAAFPKDLLSFYDKDQLSRISGIPVEHSGLYFPAAGWVKPAELCRTLADHPNISVQSNIKVESLKQEGDSWNITALNSASNEIIQFRANIAIVACATASKHLEQLSHLPLKDIRGQITEIEATDASKKLKTTVCGEGYVAPAENNRHTLGATFDFNSQSEAVNESEHLQNLEMQQQWHSHFMNAAGGMKATITGGKAGFRCTTPDYLPVVGPVIDRQTFMNDFAMLRKNSRHKFDQQPSYLKGLYINAGHGSRGMITGPLSGELLASMISGEASPVAANIMDAMNPVRFLVRDMSRNRI
ncbi:bifunctional tRNA (5-methylaminomethyl-2-thiouridine)(34)-methyltransferase MnmD/FAD-dependent 5-carboxymethylaminomethyl-2-thiouridine(34) oxidoreductase MnmC [Endozoicomonas sp. OPT23]|uniref:bifunctional tRNA (5-methylaminomethyl-2-thiouridine)(34)-methyltransferase MnmD/FAD-dependent 5-carboxymethylaminomethyl-2-thiouridine(34) oxidoreductase MnmC n=1 Tax=Endozoicomonas sp. OPT23 TaxID=2072845 RepID=UPI00129A6786|nr:bifunctional tRNA (5-methylaminomethyl-2-thiouridine)(34)-methyltransferase MnmD/FAD-dependent 5-carboxymethylaminomethyl-2-thiouridine(34) oxidoreductase MnmC [Endozoicomonas sp. OPT23]MRI34710.1 bifunctional tRNA (5-methylaminomethyl-2-thiouridine)(34)-methyltransferase MnmD/FAD-dependent 5-carboxymethylaminomethyl-2-thiouridine(34) oxidoreductase MnmC [Endozoicomonas sp. OPT23]